MSGFGGVPDIPYKSGAQTITTGGRLTLGHPFGVRPSRVQFWLECIVADVGFSVGDFYGPVPPRLIISANNEGFGQWSDAANINVEFGADSILLKISDKAGVRQNLTTASWKMHVEARK